MPAAKNFFSFDRFEIRIPENRVLFFYSFDDEVTFTHEIEIDLSGVKDTKDIEAAVFALGMAEIPSYYKNYCPAKILIRAGNLLHEQIAFWEKLYEKGLGEFFYKNGIDYRGLVFIEVDPSAPEIATQRCASESKKILVPIGGGKDSLVTGEMLKEKDVAFSWFMLEPLPFVGKLVEISGNLNMVSVGRSVEKNFGRFRKLPGAYNGHVPITATYIFSAVLVARINGFRYIILSTERSAEEGNLRYLGSDINHQYSKTFEFEKAAHSYIERYVAAEVSVFSLLRDLYEVQIMQKFVQYKKYFPYFVSCNRGLRAGKWCGECPKCAFVFAGLAAFVSLEQAVEIFGKNLFNDPALIETYKELIGQGVQKPFDCVGTFEENLLLLWIAQEQMGKNNNEPLILFREIDVSVGERYHHLLQEVTTEHLIPGDFR